MGKYAKYARKPGPKPERPHPVWRGIGCLLMIIVPTMAYALASILVPVLKASGRLPYQLFMRLQFPDWVWRTVVLRDLAGLLSRVDNFWALVIFFFASLFLLAGLFSFAYTAVYQRIGPPRYAGFDVPPSRHKTKHYKR